MIEELRRHLPQNIRERQQTTLISFRELSISGERVRSPYPSTRKLHGGRWADGRSGTRH
jgi:hypothetical protein